MVQSGLKQLFTVFYRGRGLPRQIVDPTSRNVHTVVFCGYENCSDRIGVGVAWGTEDKACDYDIYLRGFFFSGDKRPRKKWIVIGYRAMHFAMATRFLSSRILGVHCSLAAGYELSRPKDKRYAKAFIDLLNSGSLSMPYSYEEIMQLEPPNIDSCLDRIEALVQEPLSVSKEAKQ